MRLSRAKGMQEAVAKVARLSPLLFFLHGLICAALVIIISYSESSHHLQIILSMPVAWRRETIAMPPEEAITLSSLPRCRCCSLLIKTRLNRRSIN